MNPKPKKQAAVGARLMWEGAHHMGSTVIDTTQCPGDKPVFVLDAEAIEQMRETVARAISNVDANDKASYTEMATAVLASVSLTAKGAKGK